MFPRFIRDALVMYYKFVRPVCDSKALFVNSSGKDFTQMTVGISDFVKEVWYKHFYPVVDPRYRFYCNPNDMRKLDDTSAALASYLRVVNGVRENERDSNTARDFYEAQTIDMARARARKVYSGLLYQFGQRCLQPGWWLELHCESLVELLGKDQNMWWGRPLPMQKPLHEFKRK
jgi:hypothetical protein